MKPETSWLHYTICYRYTHNCFKKSNLKIEEATGDLIYMLQKEQFKKLKEQQLI